jgi:hypothetical protein
MFIVIAGAGINGVLASLMSSLLIGPPSAPAEEETLNAAPAPTVDIKIAMIKNELAAMRQLLEKQPQVVTRNNIFDPYPVDHLYASDP